MSHDNDIEFEEETRWNSTDYTSGHQENAALRVEIEKLEKYLRVTNNRIHNKECEIINLEKELSIAIKVVESYSGMGYAEATQYYRSSE